MGNKMMVQFFDLGANDGRVSKLFALAFERIKVPYIIHCFEPVEALYNETINRMKQFKNVNIHRLAVSDKNGEAEIYICKNNVGHSLFKDHDGLKGRAEKIQTVLFSDWLNKNFDMKEFQFNYNIIKINIEGAEYYLIEDILKNDLLKKFDIICGDNFKDISKVKEFISFSEKYISDFTLKMIENGVRYYHITRYRTAKISSVRKRIQDTFSNNDDSELLIGKVG